jgi:hypothetical protein
LARRKGGLAVVALLVLGGVLFWYWWSHPLLGHRKEIASAVQALQDLHSATQVGVTYAEYSKRLIDTQVLVNRAIQGKPSRKAARLAYLKIEVAMQTYKYAHDVWAAKFERGEYDWKIPFVSMRSLVLRAEGCPALNKNLEAIPLTVPAKYADQLGRDGWSQDDIDATAYQARFEKLVNSVPVIWGCASEEIATIEAEL